MCMHVSLHVCLVSEKGEKVVDSHGTGVLDGMGNRGKRMTSESSRPAGTTLRDFDSKQSKATNTASCGVSLCNPSWEAGDRWASLLGGLTSLLREFQASERQMS